jgi:hypothetical protein
MTTKTRQGAADARSSSCRACSALDGERAKNPPHDALELVASVDTESGTREEFVCKTCGQRLLRFNATQTSPAPSDVWRSTRH